MVTPAATTVAAAVTAVGDRADCGGDIGIGIDDEEDEEDEEEAYFKVEAPPPCSIRGLICGLRLGLPPSALRIPLLLFFAPQRVAIPAFGGSILPPPLLLLLLLMLLLLRP
jgi:hypothetical protein